MSERLVVFTEREGGPVCGLDEALIREGRFDIKVRVDLPDEATRVKILEAQLSKKPWKRFDLQDFARRTPGASAAKLRALVDQAANYALTDNRKIEAKDLRRAMEGNGGLEGFKDDPLFKKIFELCLLCGQCTFKCATNASMRDIVI